MAAKHKQHSAAAYAHAILDLANAKGPAEAQALAEELNAVRQIVEANPHFALFLRNPTLDEADKRRAIDSVFAGKISELLLNTLRVMNHHGRLGAFPSLETEYHRLLDIQLGNVDVEVTVASELDAPMLEEVRQRVGTVLKKNAVMRQKVDGRIIGGLLLRVGDQLIDGSVKAQIEVMKRRLLAAAP
jgi:F-type H+-transporting ATPase subunit delta